MELVRYRPADAVRWLQLGAETVRKDAQRQSDTIVRGDLQTNIKEGFRLAAGALMDFGKGALADAMHTNAFATEYVLLDDRLEIVRKNKITVIPYQEVKSIRYKHDRVTLSYANNSASIKPPAYIQSGKVKVPVGWNRNGMEVPFEVLIDELAARCKIEAESA